MDGAVALWLGLGVGLGIRLWIGLVLWLWVGLWVWVGLGVWLWLWIWLAVLGVELRLWLGLVVWIWLVLVLWLGLALELGLELSLWQPVVSPMIPTATAALRADLARDAIPLRGAEGPLALEQGVGSREEASVISGSKQPGPRPPSL
jgi:hypothetical protein